MPVGVGTPIKNAYSSLPGLDPTGVVDHVAVDHLAGHRVAAQPDIANVEPVVIQRSVQ